VETKFKSTSRNPGHAPFHPIFIFLFSILTLNPAAKVDVCIFSLSRDNRGAKIQKWVT